MDRHAPEDEIARIRDLPSLEGKVPPEEWNMRVDLAACYRMIERNGWNSNIYNHCSARVPGEPDHMIMKAHPLLWSEITASNLVKVNIHEELDESAGVNRPGFVLHSAILRGRPDVNAVVHIHESASIAVSVMKEGLMPLCQDAIFLYQRTGYHAYEGITEDADERDRIVEHLADNAVMLMRNHGSVSVGATVRDAYMQTGRLVKACKIQLDLLAAGRELDIPSEEICAKVAVQHAAHNVGRGTADWPAALREQDAYDPGYRR